MKNKILNALKHGYVIKNSKIPQMLSWVISIRAITLYPFIIFRDEPDEHTVNHERIHIQQQKEERQKKIFAGFSSESKQEKNLRKQNKKIRQDFEKREKQQEKKKELEAKRQRKLYIQKLLCLRKLDLLKIKLEHL